MHSTKETHRKLPCTPTLNQSVPLTVTENTPANGRDASMPSHHNEAPSMVKRIATNGTF